MNIRIILLSSCSLFLFIYFCKGEGGRGVMGLYWWKRFQVLCFVFVGKRWVMVLFWGKEFRGYQCFRRIGSGSEVDPIKI